MIGALDLTKKVHNRPIFGPLSFSLPEKGLVYVEGGNGSGKTTLLMLLALFDHDYEGSLTFGGQEARCFSRDERETFRSNNIVFLAPFGNLLSFLTVGENLRLISGGRLGGESLPFAARYPREISGGEYQKDVLMGAASSPKSILIIDEGLAFLDEANKGEYLSQINALRSQKLILLSSPGALPGTPDAKIRLGGGS